MFVSVLKMKAVLSFEISASTCSTTAHHYLAEDLNHQQHRSENLKFCILVAACNYYHGRPSYNNGHCRVLSLKVFYDNM
jgi:hypothetical protein